LVFAEDFPELAEPEPEVEAEVPEPAPTVMTWVGADATVLVVPEELWPMITPTPIASSRVPTPATSVAPEETRGRRG
jgi:hypothetical protein